jgi:hypothetical protein
MKFSDKEELMRGMRKGKSLKFVAAFLSLSMAATVVAACGSDNEEPDKPEHRGPVVATDITLPDGRVLPKGTATCGYVADPEECADSGADKQYWYEFPESQPSVTNVTVVNKEEPAHDFSSMLMQLFVMRMMYDMFFSGPWYQSTHIRESYRTTYNNRRDTFSNRYRSQIDAARSQGKWKTPAGKPVSGAQVDRSKFNNTKNTGGSAGSKCRSLGNVGTVSVNSLVTAALAVLDGGGRPRPPAPKPASNNGGNSRGTGGTSRGGC